MHRALALLIATGTRRSVRAVAAAGHACDASAIRGRRLPRGRERRHPAAEAERVRRRRRHRADERPASRRRDAAFKFASPANKAVTRRALAALQGDDRAKPEYRPMLACSRWEFVGMLGDDERKAARVRVFPAGGSSAPFAVQTPVIEYTFSLSKQPVVTDAGDEGYAVSGCWCTDSVVAS